MAKTDQLANFVDLKKKDNKREQITSFDSSTKSPKKEPIKAAKPAAIPRSTSSQSRSKKVENEPYVSTHLELPESLKMELDLLFIQSPGLRKKGKNNFLIDCVRSGLEKERTKGNKLP